MKKFLVLLVSIAMLTGLAACGGSGDNKSTTYKVGVGSKTSVTGKDATDKNGQFQSNVTYAGLVLDKDGKIVDLYIDVAQNSVAVDNTGKALVKEAAKTKRELKEEYNMKSTSEKTGIGKEWYEQIEAFEAYAKGKTVADLVKLEVDDAGHPTNADVKAGTTISITDIVAAIKTAEANAKEVEGVAKFGVGSTTSIKGTDAKSAEVSTTFAMVAVDKDGKIVFNSIDTAQNSATLTADGKVTVKDATPTKKERGDDYGMKAVSEKTGIGKEWYEQIAALEEASLGKTVEEFLAIPTKEANESHLHVPSDADLAAKVTITIEDYKAAVEVASKNFIDVK